MHIISVAFTRQTQASILDFFFPSLPVFVHGVHASVAAAIEVEGTTRVMMTVVIMHWV